MLNPVPVLRENHVNIRFRRFLSVDSPKAVKAQGYGFLNGINYGAPAETAGQGNMCPHASPGCLALCLGLYSGQAAMVKPGGTNNVRESRIAKTAYFMQDRPGFMAELAYHVARLHRDAAAQGMRAACRPNGAWDVAFEGIRVPVSAELAESLSANLGRKVPAGSYRNIMELFPEVRFLDYTKNPTRFARKLPDNYHLTFSLSETNESTARRLLADGHNVAAVFANGLPETYLGKAVINGDAHDLRFLDPKGGFIIGLSPKGSKAKRDQSGFVVRNYATNNA
jgi:hypothetical protein